MSHKHSALLGLAVTLLPAWCFGQEPKTEPGVLVKLYDIGQTMQQLPDLAADQKPNAVKILPTIELRDDRGDFDPLKESFITEIEAFLTQNESGDYRFRLISDDGARLWIDGRVIIDHDGTHAAEPKDGSIHLLAGRHSLRVLHFQGAGDKHLEVRWQPPGAKDFALIPADALTHAADAPRDTAPGHKRIIPPLRRGHPGDGTPVAGAHPSVRVLWAGTGARSPRDFSGLPWESLKFIASPDDRPGKSFIWLPPDPSRVTKISVLPLQAGMYKDQVLIAGYGREGLVRAFIDPAGDIYQGCIFQFTQGLAGSVDEITAAGGPGEDWVHVHVPDATISEQEHPEASVIKVQLLKPTGKVAFEMLAVRAMSNGFEIEFSKPLDPRAGWEADSYYVEQWPFDLAKSKRPTRDGATTPVQSASVSSDRRRVFLEIPGLKTSHLVYLRLLPPCLSEDRELPWSTEAWYTLNAIPKDRDGKVLTPPVPPPQNTLTEVERQTGWRLLFDGQTTKGWRGFRKQSMPDGWQALNGCLVRVGGGGDIISEDEFDNFELTLEWRIAPAGNSGIFYHVSEDEDTVWKTGPELQVLDNAEHPDGRSPYTSAGSCYGLYAPLHDVTQPVGLFNKVRILVRGPHVEHWLNDVKIVEYELGSEDWQQRIARSKFASLPKFGRMPKGHIALQDHGDKVWYRNIKIRPLKIDEEHKP